MAGSARELVRKTLDAVLRCQEADDFSTLEATLDALVVAHRSPDVVKLDHERRMVWGWASVATVDGQIVTDRQGDQLPIEELRDMAYDFVGKRVIGLMHERDDDIGEVRDTVVFDKALQDALGIDLGREGWFIGAYVKDAETWDRVKKGELRAFSIEGTGERTPLVVKGVFLSFNEALAGLVS